jgi:hypothetical protein
MFQRSAIPRKSKVRLEVRSGILIRSFFLAQMSLTQTGRRRLARRHVALDSLPQVLYRVVNAHRIDQLSGIHAVVRIPERLELPKGLHQLRTEHLRQQRGPCLPIAVLAA